MKFSFFFLFGAIKFVLAEGGSACGCGRVCVKKTLKVTWSKLSGGRAQFPGSREWKELFMVGFLSFGSGGLCPQQSMTGTANPERIQK